MDFRKPFFAEKGLLKQLLYLLLFVLTGAIVSSALGLLLGRLFFGSMVVEEVANAAAFQRLILTCNSVGTFLLPALLFAYCHERRWFHYNACDRRPHYLMVNVTLLLSIVVLPVVAALASWNEAITLPESFSGLEQWMRQMEETATQMQNTLTSQHTYATLAANLFAMALVPAVCEEFLFQGTLQRWMHKTSMNPHLVIWLTAFIFSTIHFQFFGFLPRFLLGAYLGYLYFWSRSLWLPILAHLLHNALSLLVDFTLAGRGIFMEGVDFFDMRGAVPLLLTCTLVTTMSIVFLWRVQRDFTTGEWD